MTYLLDTNVWVAFLRNPNSPIVPRLRARQPGDVCVCSVVVGELYYGCLRSANSTANRAKVEALMRPYRSLPFDDAAAEQYATVRPPSGEPGRADRTVRCSDCGHRPGERMRRGDT